MANRGPKVDYKRSLCKEGMGYCSKCDSYKTIENFYDRGTNRWCKVCAKQHNRSHYQTNRVANLLAQKRQNYGITETEYLRLLEAQGGLCAICGKPETKTYKGTLGLLAVDHNHQTGEVRGLLCSACNVGLGSFRDDRELLEKALNYLYATDSERTENHRPAIGSDYTPETKRGIESMARAVKGLPKQLQGATSDWLGLPLFGGRGGD